MAGLFIKNERIHFSQCDPAGIVFHGAYITLLDEVIEDFFREKTGTIFRPVPGGLVFPVVHLEADFKRPLRTGDEVRLELSVVHLGRTSAAFELRIKKEDVLCVGLTRTIVCCREREGTLTPEAWGTDIRAALEGML